MKTYQIHATPGATPEYYAHADTMTEVCLVVKDLLESGVETNQITVNKYEGDYAFKIVSIETVLAAGRHPSRGIFKRK